MSGMRLDPALVLGAYAVGVFPMADARDAREVYWVEPRRAAMLPLDGFHLSRSLRKTIAADRFRVTADTAFGEVVRLCAESVADRPDTWINRGDRAGLHRAPPAAAIAHSIECWDGDGSSAGSTAWRSAAPSSAKAWSAARTDASKVALAWLVARLQGRRLHPARLPVPDRRTSPRWARSRSTATTYVALLGAALSGVGRRSARARAAGRRLRRARPLRGAHRRSRRPCPARRRGKGHRAALGPDVVDRVLDDVERRALLEEPARKHPPPASVDAAHVELHERAGQLVLSPTARSSRTRAGARRRRRPAPPGRASASARGDCRCAC